MTSNQRINQIRDDLNDWIINVKSPFPMSNDDTAFLLERIEKLEELVKKADRVIIERNWWDLVKKEAGL